MNIKKKESAMVIYECDMCGKAFSDKGLVREITAHVKQYDAFDDGLRKFDVCLDCSLMIGEFISGHKSRMKGFRIGGDV
jgi:hypothetical protein